MFGFIKKEKHLTAPASGVVISLAKVKDEVFSKKILGDGFAVIPNDGNICSPANGVLTDITETNHAYCITADDGLEILVHIGIDTVELRGKGFTPIAKVGDKLQNGTPLARVDLSVLKDAGLSADVVTVVTNTDKLKHFEVLETSYANAGDRAFIYK